MLQNIDTRERENMLTKIISKEFSTDPRLFCWAANRGVSILAFPGLGFDATQHFLEDALKHDGRNTDEGFCAIECQSILHHQIHIRLECLKAIILVSVQLVFDQLQVPGVLPWNNIEVMWDLEFDWIHSLAEEQRTAGNHEIDING